MASDRPTIFLSAAEASGDDRAAALIEALREKLGEARFVGAAGPAMQRAGCESLVDLTDQAAMVSGPLANLGYWRRQVKRLRRAIADIRPDVFVPTDSPALHWHLCRAARKADVPVMYYVAPQVWAWARWRISKVRRLTDRVACVLPFEEDYFRQRGVEARFVGHPLFDDLPPQPNPADSEEWVRGWHEGGWRVAMLPGSRSSEIAGHVPGMVAVADALADRWPGVQVTFTARNDRDASTIAELAGRDDLDIAVDRTADVLAASHFALAASGTVTLEAAWFGLPMVIVHRVRPFERILYHLIARWLIHTPHLSLVNILAGRSLVPELMPWSGRIEPLIGAVMHQLEDLNGLIETRGQLMELVAPLRVPPPGSAAGRVADLVISLLQS